MELGRAIIFMAPLMGHYGDLFLGIHTHHIGLGDPRPVEAPIIIQTLPTSEWAIPMT